MEQELRAVADEAAGRDAVLEADAARAVIDMGMRFWLAQAEAEGRQLDLG